MVLFEELQKFIRMSPLGLVIVFDHEGLAGFGWRLGRKRNWQQCQEQKQVFNFHRILRSGRIVAHRVDEIYLPGVSTVCAGGRGRPALHYTSSAPHQMLKLSVPADSLRLIAIDIDGTLLNPEFQISPTDLAVLRRAHAQGIEVILVTG